MTATEFDKAMPEIVEYLKKHKRDKDTLFIVPSDLHMWLMNDRKMEASTASSAIWHMLDGGVIEFGTGGYEIVVE